MTTLHVHIAIDESYMFGAANVDQYSGGMAYWHPEGISDNDMCEIETWEVPSDIANYFTTQGTTKQHFSDGYEAYRKLRDFATRTFSPTEALRGKVKVG